MMKLSMIKNKKDGSDILFGWEKVSGKIEEEQEENLWKL